MNTTLAVLLYMHLIISPGTYFQSDIDAMATANQQQITIIENDPDQMQIVQNDDMPMVEKIVIVNDESE
jgi:2-C-methyl-D-erythritol 4-phosphate cytidylyltransferase